MGKNNLKEKLFFYTIIIMIIILILNINFALADNSTIKNQNNSSFSNNFIFEYDEQRQVDAMDIECGACGNVYPRNGQDDHVTCPHSGEDGFVETEE